MQRNRKWSKAMKIGFDNDKNFAISQKQFGKWAKMTEANDHARVAYEQITHMAKGVKNSCGVDSRMYAEIAALETKAKSVLEYRDENDGFKGGDEMYYLGYACFKMAQSIVEVVASKEAAEAYNKCA